jgi:hypothetical protein
VQRRSSGLGGLLHRVKARRSSSLQLGSQQQLTSQCGAGSRSHVHEANDDDRGSRVVASGRN